MADFWDGSSSIRTESPREFLVSAELYISTAAASGLRKPPVQRKKTVTDKRDSLMPSSRTGDESQKKVREKSSWMSLSRNPASTGQWRSAECRLSEENNKSLLNIYVDGTILYQTVYIHMLNQTDIRQADTSLFTRKHCLGIYCQAGQRWSSTHNAEPLYLQFANAEMSNTWLSLLRSYAVPEIYGRSHFPADGGLYRMWRQVELTVMQGRNLGNQKPLADVHTNTGGPRETDADAIDLDVFCEIHLNGQRCGRTTVKKGIGSPDWHESFTFCDLPPFETIEILVWREKKLLKAIAMGSIRIALTNFRRGETVEGWFPVLNSGPIATSVQVGDVRMKIRVDEEIVLPHTAYSKLLQTVNSRNFLDWIGDFESKMQLKTLSSQFMSIAVAQHSLIEQILAIADQEVDGTPHSHTAHTTLFRGNTILTKTMELCMQRYGMAFLEASIGSVIRRLCTEKIAIEVDPVRSGKSPKEAEKSVEMLVYWLREFWKQIYSVRGECPHEMRRLFEHIRKLVETNYRVSGAAQGQNRELPWQSVSAFCFLRFIVPGILNPHLYGLCPGLPPAPVQRSLTLIAKVIQSLANLNATASKEDYMRGVVDFVKESVPGMVDYLLVISTPVPESYSSHVGPAADRHDRLVVADALSQRGSMMPVLEREAVPLLPDLLDVPRNLAIVASAVIRTSKGQQQKLRPTDALLDEFISRCFEVEEIALQRVSQLASRASDNAPSSPPTNRHSTSPTTTTRFRQSSMSKSPPSSHRPRKASRPATAPSYSDLSDATHGISDISLPSSPISTSILVPPNRLLPRGSQVDLRGGQPSSPEDGAHAQQENHFRAQDSIAAQLPVDSLPVIPKPADSQTESDDQARKNPKKGILRGILRR